MRRITARMALAAAGLLLVSGGAASAQSLWPKDAGPGGLIADTTARRRGDILTILIRESHKATHEESSELEQSTSLQAALNAFGIKPDVFNNKPDIDVESSRSFDGEAKNDQTRTLETRIAVMVVDVQPNGNLVIEGRRTVQVDEDTKRVTLAGVVRPYDVTSANTVLSENVALATVKIESDGPVHRTTTRGIVGQVFDTLWHHLWPF